MNQIKLCNNGYRVVDTNICTLHTYKHREDSGHTQVKLITVIISYKGTWLRSRRVSALSEFEFF